MASFNYSALRFFQKDGTELMINQNPTCSIIINNPAHPSEYAQYLFVNGQPNGSTPVLANSSFLCMQKGTRFPLSTHLEVTVVLPDETTHNVDIYLPSFEHAPFEYVLYKSSDGLQHYPELKYNDMSDASKKSFLQLLGIYDYCSSYFPTNIISTNLTFDKVSTNLVETQTIIALTEDPSTGNLIDVKTYANDHADASTYISKYELMFFVDCREHRDFRFFYLDGDEVVWSDRMYIDFSKGVITGENNGYRVDVGFIGEDEGVYESTMYICLIGKQDQSINVIGKINLTAETEGLDERYKTLFTNFGLPDMNVLEPSFKDTDINEAYPDYISINRHAKKIFLTYADIFPYAGSYKGLFNAMRLFGYDDVYFKEWYKEIGESTKDDLGYVTFDITDNFRTGLNTINNKPIEERIHLRKLNWVSMMYKLNDSIDSSIDQWGFPETINLENYYTTGNLMKLISLKQCLDKYITGINCRITDVGGEGVTFERYQVNAYGQYQRVLDYINNKHIAAVIDTPVSTLKDSSAYIQVSVNTLSGDTEIESFEGITVADFCEGYFDTANKYHDVKDGSINDDSSITFFGKTFEMNDNMNTFEVHALGKCDSFRFNSDFIDPSSPSLIVDGNKIIFDPHDLLTKRRNTAFTNLPVIQIQEGRIKRYEDNKETFGNLIYDSNIKHSTRYEYVTELRINDYSNDSSVSLQFNDVITLIPPTYTYDSTYSYINPKFSAQNKRRNVGKYTMPDVTSPINIDISDRTYGLRYVTSDINGIPTFMIAGYECPLTTLGKSKIHYPLTNDSSLAEPYEYYIEIVKGRMIFADPTNERKVMLNFDYKDGKRIIFVSTYQYSNGFTLNKYKTSASNYVERFQPGTAYQYFVNLYKTSPESAIIFDKEHKLKVYNTGAYEIDAVLFDEHNNLFAHKANGNARVITPDIDASTYSPETTSGNEYDQHGIPAKQSEVSGISALLTNEEGKCILSYERKRNISNKTVDSDTSIYSYDISGLDTISNSKIDNGSTTIPAEESYDFAEMSSNSVRFDCVSYKKISSTTLMMSLIRRSYRDSSAGSVMVDGFADLVRSCKKESIPTPYNLNTISDMMTSFMTKTKTSPKGTPLDVNFTLYDESGEFPILSYPGIMMSVYGYKMDPNYFWDEYRLYIDADIVEGGSLSDIDEIASFIQKPYVSVYVNPCWNMKSDTALGSCIYLQTCATVGYPFIKQIPKGDCYRVTFTKYKNSGIDYLPSPWEVTMIDASLMELEQRPKGTDTSYEDGDVYYDASNGLLHTRATEGDYQTVPQGNLPYVVIGGDTVIIPPTSSDPTYGYPHFTATDLRITDLLKVHDASVEPVPIPPTPDHRPYVGNMSVLIDGQGDDYITAENINFGSISRPNYEDMDPHTAQEEHSREIRLFVAPSTQEFTTYTIELDKKLSDPDNGTITMKNTPINRELGYYIDTTYAVTLRNFDSKNSILMWSDSSVSSLNNKLSYNCPITTHDKFVTVVPVLSEAFSGHASPIEILTTEQYTAKWSIYKQHGDSKRKLLIECYNSILYLELPEKGIYDIGLDVYDKNGNKYSKFLDGAILYE